MKYIRMFESAEQAAAILPTLEYNTLSAIRGESGISLNPGVVPPGPDYTEPFYIEDISGSENTVQIKASNNQASSLMIEKSLDKENWELMGNTSTSNITATVPANGKLYLRCNTTQWADSNWYTTISSSNNCNVGGNIMSLLYGNNFTGEETSFPTNYKCAFMSLFQNSTHIINSNNLLLPATTLTLNCYYNMFNGCTSLTTAPALPATTLALCCYQGMFQNCTSLTTAPALPATTMATSCYQSMFSGCTLLTTAPALHALTAAASCYREMFQNCTSLTTAPTLPATTLANQCYANMFRACTSLTTAPVLPATALTESCYQGMFQNCTSLTTAPELPATTMARSCYSSMFKNCSSLTTAPVLIATTLTQYCYSNMFNGCSLLNEITTYADDNSASDCTYIWLNNVASSGTFHNLGTATYPSSVSGIPEGWTEVQS